MADEELFGPIPPGWKYKTLGAACAEGGGDIQTGPFGSQLHAADYVAVGIPSIMPQNIGDNRLHEEGIARITAEDAQRLSRYLVRTGDIVYSRRGDVERRALVRAHEDGWLCGTGCLRVRLGEKGADPQFVSYYLGHPGVREWIVRHAHGATMPNLNTSILSACPFLEPPIEEQRAIAHILGTLDNKIELNRRANETLEAMARTLFKAWFVDFEPVRAKMEGRWQRGQSLPGLPAHLYDLFPDRLVESELGEIPEGWEMRSLDSIANYLNGLALQKFPPESETEFLPVIKIAQLRAGNTNGADKASTEIKPEYVVVDGDVLFSWSGSLEVEVWNGGRGALNQHLFKITSNEVPKWFYFFATRQHLSDFRAIAAGKATTMGHIQRKHLTDARIAVAPPESMTKFDAVIASQFDQLVSNAQQSRSLAQLRDTLLPKLISGELRIKDAEAFLKERGL